MLPDAIMGNIKLVEDTNITRLKIIVGANKNVAMETLNFGISLCDIFCVCGTVIPLYHSFTIRCRLS